MSPPDTAVRSLTAVCKFCGPSCSFDSVFPHCFCALLYTAYEGSSTIHPMVTLTHKVCIYKEYHSVCPLVGIGTLPTPLSPASAPPPRTGGGGTIACGWGVGGVPIPTTGEKAKHSAYSVPWHISLPMRKNCSRFFLTVFGELYETLFELESLLTGQWEWSDRCGSNNQTSVGSSSSKY
jgi:hypothetical protein